MKNNNKFPRPNVTNPLSRRRELFLFMEGQVIMHLGADIGSRTKILLRKI